MTEERQGKKIPLYIRIAEDMKSRIRRGELHPNTRIPTEMELSKTYQTSRVTIRRALELLIDEEILVRKQQMGTFISGKKLSRNLNSFMGFSQSCEAAGNRPGTRLLAAELVDARPSDIKNLGLQEKDKVIGIRRLRYCNDVPVILEQNYFPKKYAWLLAEDLNGSLHQLLQDHGIRLGNGSKTIEVCYATKEEAEQLGIKEGDALIVSKDIVYDGSGEPVYSGRDVINGDRYEYKICTYSMVEDGE